MRKAAWEMSPKLIATGAPGAEEGAAGAQVDAAADAAAAAEVECQRESTARRDRGAAAASMLVGEIETVRA